MNVMPNSPQARDIENVAHPYTNLAVHREKGPLIMERGKGVFVYDDEGKEYIEGMAGLWCTALGFGEQELIDAAVQQFRELPYYHSFGHKSFNPAIDLAEKLKQIAPAEFSKVFFCTSGSEANDTQVKLVWYYNNAIGRPEKKKIISRMRGYHGVTVASASLTGLPPVHADFDLPIPQVKHAACPHYYRFGKDGESEDEFSTRMAQELEELIIAEGPDTVAAFIAEPVMGAGGVIIPPKGYFEKVQPILKKYDILMIADEVICGFGRTGEMWGSQTFNIQPDMLTCAKQLSSAYLPISAVMICDKVFEAMIDESKKIGSFAHGYTYGGHPVPAAVAKRNLELYEERDIMGHVKAMMPRFNKRFAELGEHPLVGEVRSVGLIGAIELVKDKKTKESFDPKLGLGLKVNDWALEHGLVTRMVAGDNLALCPPLIITESEIDEMFRRMELALNDAEQWLKKEGHI
jgi:4-aminobutyrate--pyruvate transaminase